MTGYGYNLIYVVESRHSYFILSDWGFNGSDDQKMVAYEMEAISKLIDLKFILTCGDNFQKTGVKSTTDLQWSTNYEDVYTDSSLLVPWYPALGNHDYYEDPEVQVEYSAINDLWNMPSRYYTFVEEINATSSVRFIVLDTQGIIEEYRELTNATYYNTIAQYSWFKKLLSEASEEWIIVTGHHPVFSANLYHGDSKEMNVMIKPLLDEYNVDFYLCGHDHNFEHAREEGKDTDYFVNGTGGSLRPSGNNERTVYSVSKLGYTYISLSQNLARLYFITNEGRIGYQYDKVK